MSAPTPPPTDWHALAAAIARWGRELGFREVGIADTELGEAEARLHRWLAAGRHGEMHYMEKHGTARSRPAELVPGTVRVISVRMDYWPGAAADAEAVLHDTARAYVARYALGRDYHKVLRARLQKLVDRIAAEVGAFGHRVFTDCGPVLEVALSARSSSPRRSTARSSPRPCGRRACRRTDAPAHPGAAGSTRT